MGRECYFRNDLPGVQNPTNYINMIKQRFPVEKDDTSYRFAAVIRDYYDGKKDLDTILFEVLDFSRFLLDCKLVSRTQRSNPGIFNLYS